MATIITPSGTISTILAIIAALIAVFVLLRIKGGPPGG